MTTNRFGGVKRLALTLLLTAAAPVGAINIVLDYSYEPSTSASLFYPASLDGQRARATLSAAADYFSAILDDTFSSIETPPDYISTAPGGAQTSYSWDWQAKFSNPTSGSEVTISNPTIAEDEYRIYVGSRNFPGTTLGVGGPGGLDVNSGGSYYFNWQLEEIDEINAQFVSDVQWRGEAGGFANWGGALSMDRSANWHVDHTTAPSSGENDLFSVALHEMGHALGVGASDEWNALVNGASFTGPQATSVYGSSPPLYPPGHWNYNTMSTVYGGTAIQEAAMDPDIEVGTRKLWTTLDAAAMTDIGWTVVAPPGLAGDYNGDNLVDAADYTVWRDNRDGSTPIGSYAEWSTNYGATASSATTVPEPGALCVTLAAVALAAASPRRW